MPHNIQQAAKRLWHRHTPKEWKKIGAILLILLLLLTTCISTISASNIHHAYSSARTALGERLYAGLFQLMNLYQAAEAGGGNEERVLQELVGWFTFVTELNSYLTQAYGTRYTLLSSERISTLDTAISRYCAARRTGLSLSEAQFTMTACMNALENLLDQRYTDDMRLLPD